MSRARAKATVITRRRLLHPRHWPLWLGLGLLWLITRLPHRAGMAIGRALGRLSYRLAKSRRHIAQVNVRLCFPELSEAEREALVRRNFEYTGMTVIEMGWAWWVGDERFAPLGEIQGLEHLQAALARGQGVLLVGGHFTSLEIAGRLLVPHANFPVTYRAHKNPVMEYILRRARNRYYDSAIERHDVRGMIRALRKGMPVWYAPDQDYGRRHSVFVPFCGVSAATVTGTARLAGMSKATIIPAQFYHRPDGRYQIILHPPLEGYPSGDEHADAWRINAFIEEWVRQRPEQYLWAHRRFKTRPEGEPRPY
ncbi:LpxL/LpxP family Kdo(2)-lipid IV(A) lauroyl/palmitoleoyl acyltransferase [Alkalilimnicola sp. S0819]|uniref:LpxL/LpxP family Kdo(2)-lipid IV(A) lauroyl/palmitoleoyl acyltransferase n=1 Tax=Alkalilimnicola sp. S0819 TaxID=2613922 RepID=UPI0012620EB9|nr:LpxL/LpxP family Kdo(2)-lipid IV(A) lauroyl/palmitoleoyl acyltransferase [Alkalilimnicola sp. S0819]KAB7627330.1 LpxL/LpxP family Kdo(2)-lipid IV(A) lauroyl/palmitoleoyl acyltransferase [Alkalilimnicola sp. S0819]MPQ16046.1 LpxL/LpxP family Kdo(2)-lipid IV(A) lauroyl/palmitoleoyl acyltransferase [Alkalilimnicola sp. S0819]